LSDYLAATPVAYPPLPQAAADAIECALGETGSGSGMKSEDEQGKQGKQGEQGERRN